MKRVKVSNPNCVYNFIIDKSVHFLGSNKDVIITNEPLKFNKRYFRTK
mgnify:CR=1 FL=1